MDVELKTISPHQNNIYKSKHHSKTTKPNNPNIDHFKHCTNSETYLPTDSKTYLTLQIKIHKHSKIKTHTHTPTVPQQISLTQMVGHVLKFSTELSRPCMDKQWLIHNADAIREESPSSCICALECTLQRRRLALNRKCSDLLFLSLGRVHVADLCAFYKCIFFYGSCPFIRYLFIREIERECRSGLGLVAPVFVTHFIWISRWVIQRFAIGGTREGVGCARLKKHSNGLLVIWN